MVQLKKYAFHGWIGAYLCAGLCLLYGTVTSHNVLKRPWNHPYEAIHDQEKMVYSSISEAPKTLDPARSFSSDESVFISQVAEPLLQFDYLARPYRLVPLSLKAMPQRKIIQQGKQKKVVYAMTLRDDLRYAPHPGFAKNSSGKEAYYPLTTLPPDARSPYDFPQKASRRATSEDIIYQLKRLADPEVGSPIYSIFEQYIEDFSALRERIGVWRTQHPGEFLDLRRIPFYGAQVKDATHFEIILKRDYSAFEYWLASTFVSPAPWEIDRFYAQPILKKNNISWSSYPVGTGPFYLAENNPNRRLWMKKSNDFHEEYFPKVEHEEDIKLGLEGLSGKKLPLCEGMMFVLEKEALPRWNKFLQGYYDASGVSTDVFQQAVQIDERGQWDVAPSLKKKGIRFTQEITPSLMYWGVNMLDPVVGSASPQGEALRHALAIAINVEEYIAIFLNGAGVPAFGVVPPGLLGHIKDCPPHTHEKIGSACQRRSLAEAKAWMVRAGYPEGIDPQTQKPLVLHLDSMSGGSMDAAYYGWMKSQFANLGIELNIRDTTYNRFQNKIRQGEAQLFQWGWLADYPDAENFLGIFYGPNGKTRYQGENATNYHNADFDRGYEAILQPTLPLKQRAEHFRALQKQLQKELPILAGYFPKSLMLRHSWIGPVKYHAVAHNTLKYMSVDALQRDQSRRAWNQPHRQSVYVFLWLLWCGIGGIEFYRQREDRRMSVRRRDV